MGKIDNILINMESEMENCETIKYLILKQLREDNHINDEVEKDFNDNWQIILVKKSWFKRLYNRLKKEGVEDGYSYQLVKFYYGKKCK